MQTLEQNELDSNENNTVEPAVIPPLVKHILGGGVFIKTYLVPAGTRMYTKQFDEDHICILAQGSVILENKEDRIKFVAPAHCNIPANNRLGVVALENSVWYCIHPTTDTDLDALAEKY